MNYFDNTPDNEAEKVKQGEREFVTLEMLVAFVGGDNPNGEILELALDMLNKQYPVEDAVSDIKNYWAEIY